MFVLARALKVLCVGSGEVEDGRKFLLFGVVFGEIELCARVGVRKQERESVKESKLCTLDCQSFVFNRNTALSQTCLFRQSKGQS